MAQRVGKRVRVYWSDEEEWFEGIVQEYDAVQGNYVVYDDGDERWEPHGQSMLVEGEEEDQEVEPSSVDGAHDPTPEMMEPPASPGSDYYYEDDEVEQSETHQQSRSTEEDGLVEHQHDPSSDVDDTDHQDVLVDQQDDREAEGKDSHEDNATRNRAEGGLSPDSDSDAESVAESEMPQTFGKSSIEVTGTRASPSAVPVPVKGVLEGRVLRATGLQTSRALAPNAFVRVSFVVSGDATHTSTMLRCKETLSTTNIVRGSANPVWSEDILSNDNQRGSDTANGGFQLELLPRTVPPATKPAWHQLPGDVLFTVFSASRMDGSARNGANEHIGQATVSLRSLVQDLLTMSPFASRVLELRSRSGKRLGYGNTSTRSLFDDGRAEVPTLGVSFCFIPTYESKTTPTVPRSLRSVPSRSRLETRAAPAESSPRASVRQEKARRMRPAQTSSSSINRRRFEKQVAKDNRSFAKRLEWKEARRTRQSAQAQAQEKKKVTPPQHGARKHGHQASSTINRTKYVQQVAAENKAIGKRLQSILGNDEGARNPGKVSSWAAAEPKDSTNYDYLDRDKAHAQDRRWQRQVELDFLMEKAQTKYQQHNELVEEVMELQEAVGTLKTQADSLNKSVLRLDILNKKDQHVRDCLLRAAATTGSSTVKASPRALNPLSKGSSKTAAQSSANEQDGESSGKRRKEQELELLTQHRGRLLVEKQKLSQELLALTQQELHLDQEIHDQQSKWELAVATQLFHRQMDKKDAAKEMKRRQKALELSREEEEQWAAYQARQELIQLQIALQVVRDRSGEQPRRLAARREATTSSSAVCDYLTTKIAKQKSKLQQLQEDVERRRSDYEELLVSGGHERRRKRVQELQNLVFLCQTQAAHVKKADKMAQRKGERVDWDFQRRLFKEQTETEIVLKRPPKQHVER